MVPRYLFHILDASPRRQSDILLHIFPPLSSQCLILTALLQDADGQSCDSYTKCLINDFSAKPKTLGGVSMCSVHISEIKTTWFHFYFFIKEGGANLSFDRFPLIVVLFLWLM